mgnify:CR=1 FL=1
MQKGIGLTENNMKNTVTLFGLEIDVTFDDSETFEFTTSNGDVYEETAITDDNRLIAFDNAVCAYVQLSGNASEAL